MQFQIDALEKGKFKKTVEVLFPSEKLNAKGETEYDKAIFVGLFQNIDEAAKDHFNSEINRLRTELSELDENSELTEREKQKRRDEIQTEIDDISITYMQQYFVGFEKHPKHDFPFLVGDAELSSTPENLARILNIQRVREQVSETYFGEINAYQHNKLNKMLLGNSRK